MIRAWIIVFGALLFAQFLSPAGWVPEIVSVANAGTEVPAGSDLLAQNQAASESAADRAIDLDKRQKSRFRYLMLGYGLIWLILGAFMLSLNRRVTQVGQEISELSGRLEDTSRSRSRT